MIPIPAGGGVSDVGARFVAKKLTEDVGQNVVVGNRGGAVGIIGCSHVAEATPDGYAVLVGDSGNLSLAPNLYTGPPYKPLIDFLPLSLLGTGPRVLVVHPSVSTRSVKELVALAKARPGQLNFALEGRKMARPLEFGVLRRCTFNFSQKG